MSIYKRGSVWWYYLVHGGIRHRGSTGYREKAPARRFHDELQAELWKEQRGDSLHGALRAWAKGKGEPDRYRVEKLIREIPDQPKNAVDGTALAKAIPGASVGTYNRYVNVLHAAGVEGLEPRKGATKRIRWLTAEEWTALRGKIPEHLGPMADFAIATGLRQANVFWLEWAQVDLQRGRLWIHADEAKGKRDLGIKLASGALRALEGQRGKSDVWVFPMRDGNPLPKLKTRDWKAIVRAADIRYCTWHDLRHTWATWHLMGGTPKEVLKELGGWKDSRMVERYAHLAKSFVDNYVENAQPYSHNLSHTAALSA